MITSSVFGRKGRLGNQLFQYAALMGIAAKNNVELRLPPWVYSKYFKGDFPEGDFKGGKIVSETSFHYNPEPFAKAIALNKGALVDISGYMQSEKYWADAVNKVKYNLHFKSEFISKVMDQHWPVSDRGKHGKRNIAISVRRGDYVGNENYELLPITYYFLALEEHFPAWQDCNLLIFSDDPEYCKAHFGCLPNAYIIPNEFDYMDASKYWKESEPAMIQLAMMSLCDDFIIANSTFSWWGAYLGERKGTKVVRPAHHFAGKLFQDSDTKDHYPERWITFDHKDEHGGLKKIDLSDVTFTIPVSYDHNDRKQNMDLTVCLLQRYFDTNIIVGEHGSNFFSYFQQYCRYTHFSYREFHRTRMLNDLAHMAETDILANWDADVFVPPIQMWLTVESIRKGAQVVYPYDGRFARVNRDPWFKKLEQHLDIGILGGTSFKGMNSGDALSVGGAIFYNLEAFLDAGGENENFVSYGPEDVERYERFTRLEMRVTRIPGVLYHLDHFRGPYSQSKTNRFRKQNEMELSRIKSMNKQQLTKYIDLWNWKKEKV